MVDERDLASRKGRLLLKVLAARAATSLLGVGEVLVDEVGAEWAQQVAREAQALLRRARAATAASSAALGDHAGALAAASAAIDADALDEEAHRALMLAHYR